MTRLLPLPLILLLAAAGSACTEPDLVETVGPDFELSDTSPSAKFVVEVRFEPKDARYGHVETLSIISELARTAGDQPIPVDLLITYADDDSGNYASTKVDNIARALNYEIQGGSLYNIEFLKRGPGTVRALWNAVLDPEISDYPSDKGEPTPHLEIKAAD